MTGFLLILFFSACSFSYKLEGGSLNYDMVKTITIRDFPVRAAVGSSPVGQIFDQALRDRYIEQTRLRSVDNNGDIQIEGEITGYNFQNMAVKEDAYASMTRLTITVHVKYTNTKEQNSDVDQTFSAHGEFQSDLGIDAVQDQLVREIVTQLIDMIYNATVANW
ncbi:hypothetical protein AGMMS50262_13460 [Bacteroidia bacterium]|nr:hypothetical protein AGMMS50262_13460 [Bacteroidia bacterium]